MAKKKEKFLTLEEKRAWLAGVFRDASGEYSQADKFKAMVEDTRLAMLETEPTRAAAPPPPGLPAELLAHLPPPLSEDT